MNDQPTCPRCDGQGTILLAEVRKTGIVIHLCDECDAMWPEGEQLSMQTFTDFGTYMKSNGLTDDWSEIRIIPRARQTR